MTKILMITLQYHQFNDAQLFGCFNDGKNFKKSISKIEKISDNDIIWMRDDLPFNDPLYPKRKNILQQLRKIILLRHNKIFFYFSGHGYTITDYNNDEINLKNNVDSDELFRLNSLNNDSCIVTNETNYLNIITDDEIFNYLSINNSNQTIYGFFDCCYSGTIFDLAYISVIEYKNNFPEFKNFSSSLEYSKNNCNCLKSHYPNKIGKVNGEIHLISGCRDKQYSYESESNGLTTGHFTTKLCQILSSNDIKNYTIEDVFYLLAYLINNKTQIPVYSSNKDFDLNKIKPWEEKETILSNYSYNLKWWLLRYYRNS